MVYISDDHEPFQPGDRVTITEGTFAGSEGIVESVDLVKRRIVVLISIYGRDTPLGCMYSQAQRLP
jgi:transcriptional antiterminator NusG